MSRTGFALLAGFSVRDCPIQGSRSGSGFLPAGAMIMPLRTGPSPLVRRPSFRMTVPDAYPMPDSLHDLARDLDQFASDCDWHRYHAPKNLASAPIVEAAELLERFQWMTEAESRALSAEKLAEVRGEMADVLLYLVRLSNALGVDLVAAGREKLAINAPRFPVGGMQREEGQDGNRRSRRPAHDHLPGHGGAVSAAGLAAGFAPRRC